MDGPFLLIIIIGFFIHCLYMKTNKYTKKIGKKPGINYFFRPKCHAVLLLIKKLQCPDVPHFT